MVGLISGWLGNALASGAAVGKPVEDKETAGGLSEVLAEILANLQATFAGQPLDVEISYEPGSTVRAPQLSLSAQARHAMPFLMRCLRLSSRHSVAASASATTWNTCFWLMEVCEIGREARKQRLTLRLTPSWCLFWSPSSWTHVCLPSAKSGMGRDCPCSIDHPMSLVRKSLRITICPPKALARTVKSLLRHKSEDAKAPSQSANL